MFEKIMLVLSIIIIILAIITWTLKYINWKNEKKDKKISPNNKGLWLLLNLITVIVYHI